MYITTSKYYQNGYTTLSVDIIDAGGTYAGINFDFLRKAGPYLKTRKLAK